MTDATPNTATTACASGFDTALHGGASRRAVEHTGMTEITRRDFEMTNGRRGERANGCVVETYKRKMSAVISVIPVCSYP